MKYFSITLTTLALTGCVNATMTTSPISEYGPVEQDSSKVGIIEYLDNSQLLDSIRQANRESAYKQMFEVCNGKYSIVEEYTRQDAEVTQSSWLTGTEVKTADRYNVIEFQCL
ncbi:hypothetical protein OPW19_04890 [Vibrio europaeus]|nr:hypothetical protein [Vibrio europaeus]